MTSNRLPELLARLLAVAVCCACGPEETATTTITRSRHWRPVGRTAVAGLSSAERFGYADRAASPAPAEDRLTWTTPEGWSELPADGMRRASFRVADDPRAECYLVVLGGTGGGLLANVNRWRGQMGLPDLDPAALEAQPRSELLGRDAVLVDLTGTWQGMSGDEDAEDHRLVGLIAVDEAEASFLKMVGPADVLADEVDAFLALARSFREGSHVHVHGESEAARSSSLSWSAPDAWRRAADRPMREVTYRLGDSGEGECYVTLLGGTGGGAFANANRWRGQMGRDPLSDGDFAGLERIPMLGTEGVLVEVDGTYRGMGDELVEAATLLGAICELPGRAVFVKLIGPSELVHAARGEFVAFCESLEYGG